MSLIVQNASAFPNAQRRKDTETHERMPLHMVNSWTLNLNLTRLYWTLLRRKSVLLPGAPMTVVKDYMAVLLLAFWRLKSKAPEEA